MSRELQSVNLIRSGDADIHVSGVCDRPTHPRLGLYAEIVFTLEAVMPHSHRWATFDATLCSEGKSQFADFCATKQRPRKRVSFLRILKLAIKYSSKREYSDLYRFADVGGYGKF